jgi:hypothetical protein
MKDQNNSHVVSKRNASELIEEARDQSEDKSATEDDISRDPGQTQLMQLTGPSEQADGAARMQL